jgi:YebC/PmpR family DNA-binding regulatory protein
MSGHNKWSKIKHKKAHTDAKKGKVFTRLIKEITIAAKDGGGDPDHNAKLRMLLDKAKEANMPIENTTRAIKKGTGELPGVHYEEHTYEGYGPGGIAIFIETLTDNKNRTVADIRHVLGKHGCHLGETGSVHWMFQHLGSIKAKADDISEDELLEKLIDFDITSFDLEDGIFFIHCNLKELDKVKKAVEKTGLKVTDAELEWIAESPMALNESDEKKAVDFLSAIEDIEDVQNVYTNLG